MMIPLSERGTGNIDGTNIKTYLQYRRIPAYSSSKLLQYPCPSTKYVKTWGWIGMKTLCRKI